MAAQVPLHCSKNFRTHFWTSLLCELAHPPQGQDIHHSIVSNNVYPVFRYAMYAALQQLRAIRVPSIL